MMAAYSSRNALGGLEMSMRGAGLRALREGGVVLCAGLLLVVEYSSKNGLEDLGLLTRR